MSASLVGFGDVYKRQGVTRAPRRGRLQQAQTPLKAAEATSAAEGRRGRDCLLYTSDAADDM
eukprot:7952869-Alexandrium_andersonii.AAC.1